MDFSMVTINIRFVTIDTETINTNVHDHLYSPPNYLCTYVMWKYFHSFRDKLYR